MSSKAVKQMICAYASYVTEVQLICLQGDAEHEPLHDPAEQHASDGHLRLVARSARLHLKVGRQPHSDKGG